MRKDDREWDRGEPAPGPALIKSYGIDPSDGQWYVRDKRFNTRHGLLRRA